MFNIIVDHRGASWHIYIYLYRLFVLHLGSMIESESLPSPNENELSELGGQRAAIKEASDCRVSSFGVELSGVG